MSKAPPNTRDQLKALIASHAVNVATPKPAVQVAQTIPTPAVPSKPLPDTQGNIPTQARILTRQSLRLLPMESDKITTVINNTIERTGIRATATDVLRAGLAKLPNESHITAEELISLRSSDRRRISK